MDFGKLEMQGPESRQERVCPRGRRCVLSGIYGAGLKVGDAVRVLLACGTDTAVARTPGDGVATSTDGEVYDFGHELMLAEVKHQDAIFVLPVRRVVWLVKRTSRFQCFDVSIRSEFENRISGATCISCDRSDISPCFVNSC